MSSILKSNSLRLLLVSPPGGGKGTIINKIINSNPSFLASDSPSPFIVSSGTILRNNKNNDLIKSYMESGKLVPNEIVNNLVLKEIENIDLGSDAQANKLVIFDGFPRNKEQCKFLKENLSKEKQINMVIEIDTPQKLIIDRCVNRFIHLKSGRSYNLSYNPPKVPMEDDITHEPLVQRDDDKLETVVKRLEDYNTKLKGIKEFFNEEEQKKTVLFHQVDGETSDINFTKIQAILSKYFEK